MKRLRWCLVLSIANLAMALGLQGLSRSEYLNFRKARPDAALYEITYMPLGQVISYSLNAPSFVVSNAIHPLPLAPATTLDYGYGHFYLAAFVFWWFLGWKLDRRPSESGGTGGTVSVAGNLLGALLSVAFLCIGVAGSVKHLISLPVTIAVAAWGLGLTFYFGSRFVFGVRDTAPKVGDPVSRGARRSDGNRLRLQ